MAEQRDGSIAFWAAWVFAGLEKGDYGNMSMGTTPLVMVCTLYGSCSDYNVYHG